MAKTSYIATEPPKLYWRAALALLGASRRVRICSGRLLVGQNERYLQHPTRERHELRVSFWNRAEPTVTCNRHLAHIASLMAAITIIRQVREFARRVSQLSKGSPARGTVCSGN